MCGFIFYLIVFIVPCLCYVFVVLCFILMDSVPDKVGGEIHFFC